MNKIIAKWLLIPLGAGLVFAATLGSSPGGVALTPILLIICLVVGLVGACIHVNYYAFKFGYKNTRVKAISFTAFALLISFLAIYSSSICGLTEEYALERVTTYFESDEAFNPRYIKDITFLDDHCEYKVSYQAPDYHIDFIITAGGDLNISQPNASFNDD